MSTHDREARTRVPAVGRLDAKNTASRLSSSVLALLRIRQIHVPADTLQHIEDCTDDALLDRWLARASTANLAEDIFNGPARPIP